MLRKTFDLARRIRRGERFKYAVFTLSRVSLHARQRLNKGVFAIDIQASSGFFSVMQMVLFTLMYCEEKRLTPQISARSGRTVASSSPIACATPCPTAERMLLLCLRATR